MVYSQIMSFTSRDVRFGSKVERIGTKWTKLNIPVHNVNLLVCVDLAQKVTTVQIVCELLFHTDMNIITIIVDFIVLTNQLATLLQI